MLVFAVYIGRAEITPDSYPLFLRSAKTAFMVSTAMLFRRHICLAGQRQDAVKLVPGIAFKSGWEIHSGKIQKGA